MSGTIGCPSGGATSSEHGAPTQSMRIKQRRQETVESFEKTNKRKRDVSPAVMTGVACDDDTDGKALCCDTKFSSHDAIQGEAGSTETLETSNKGWELTPSMGNRGVESRIQQSSVLPWIADSIPVPSLMYYLHPYNNSTSLMPFANMQALSQQWVLDHLQRQAETNRNSQASLPLYGIDRANVMLSSRCGIHAPSNVDVISAAVQLASLEVRPDNEHGWNMRHATIFNNGSTVNHSHKLTMSSQSIETLNKSTKQLPSSIRPPQPSQRKKEEFRFSKGTILHISDDIGKLNGNQIFLRLQIEYFRATEYDVLSITRSKNKPIVLHQVGIRCRHCSHLPVGQRKKGSTYFPSNLMGIYQAAQNLSVEHLQRGLCTELPQNVKEDLTNMFHHALTRPVASGKGKKYWAEAGRKVGLVDTEDGIHFAVDLLEK